VEFHPYAEIFPLIDDADFDQLADDIKAHGLREPIWTYEGQILDGRNRFMACAAAKVNPQFRQYTGTDALAFVLSLNVHRRHLTESQRAMAAAKIATLSKGSNQHTARAASSQSEAAAAMHVSTDSVQRARKVIEKGSKALQHAVETGELSVKKAASVVALPKAEQLKAATSKQHPEPVAAPTDDTKVCQPDSDEAAQLEQAEKDYTASIEKVMASDDRLAAAHAEIKRQAAEIATLKLSRNQFQNQCAELIRKVKALQRALDRSQLSNGKHNGVEAHQ
jgi:hypothetical protein